MSPLYLPLLILRLIKYLFIFSSDILKVLVLFYFVWGYLLFIPSRMIFIYIYMWGKKGTNYFVIFNGFNLIY